MLISLVNALVRGLQPPDGQALNANYIFEMKTDVDGDGQMEQIVKSHARQLGLLG